MTNNIEQIEAELFSLVGKNVYVTINPAGTMLISMCAKLNYEGDPENPDDYLLFKVTNSHGKTPLTFAFMPKDVDTICDDDQINDKGQTVGKAKSIRLKSPAQIEEEESNFGDINLKDLLDDLGGLDGEDDGEDDGSENL
jgi:hypothetical protein